MQDKAHLHGFTLVEMSMVIIVIGLVMLTVFPALTAVRKSNEIALTQSNLRSLMLATAAYIQANGCLPCPARPGGTATSFGTTGTDSAAACGACTNPQGIPPFVALGLPAATAHDGWGHWITMRVDPVLTNPSPAVVPPAQPCTATDVSNGICLSEDIGKSAKGLCKAGLDATDRISVTTAKGGAKQPAAVIFVSHGQTGYGSYVAAPTRTGFLQPFDSNYLACPNAEGNASKGFAQCNSAERNSRYFYDAPAAMSSIDSYDDLLAYADRNALVAMLGNGACQSTW